MEADLQKKMFQIRILASQKKLSLYIMHVVVTRMEHTVLNIIIKREHLTRQYCYRSNI